jgi:hypothetical protein
MNKNACTISHAVLTGEGEKWVVVRLFTDSLKIKIGK